MKHSEKTIEEWFELGGKYHENEEYDKAVDAFRHVVKINKNTNGWFNLGLALRFQGNLTEAFKAFSTAQKLDPGNGEIYLQQGLILIGQEKNEQALKKFVKAFESGLEPGNQAVAFVGMGISFVNLDKTDDAIRNFDAVLRLDSRNLPALTMKAGAILTQGNPMAAKDIIDEALRIDPEDAEALTILRLIESALR